MLTPVGGLTLRQFTAWLAEQGASPAFTTYQAGRICDVDIHDIGLDDTGRPIFVNTLFSCLATVNERYSFEAL